jgi:hypothetical protein
MTIDDLKFTSPKSQKDDGLTNAGKKFFNAGILLINV